MLKLLFELLANCRLSCVCNSESSANFKQFGKYLLNILIVSCYLLLQPILHGIQRLILFIGLRLPLPLRLLPLLLDLGLQLLNILINSTARLIQLLNIVLQVLLIGVNILNRLEAGCGFQGLEDALVVTKLLTLDLDEI